MDRGHRQIVGSVSFPAQADAVMDAIRARAHQLWEAAGRPAGRDLEFWLQAEAEVIARVEMTDDQGPLVPRPSPPGSCR